MFSAWGSLAASLMAQGSVQDHARMQEEASAHLRGHRSAMKQLGVSIPDAKPRKAMRCQSCAAPMRWHVCDYCGTTHG